LACVSSFPKLIKGKLRIVREIKKDREKETKRSNMASNMRIIDQQDTLKKKYFSMN